MTKTDFEKTASTANVTAREKNQNSMEVCRGGLSCELSICRTLDVLELAEHSKRFTCSLPIFSTRLSLLSSISLPLACFFLP